MGKNIQIGIMGPDSGELPKDKRKRRYVLATAETLGSIIASRGAVVFTGGTGGVMEYASKGAKASGGITVGVPGRERGASNKYVDVEILTDIDVGSFIFGGMHGCDAIIFIPGGAGTLAELCIAYRLGKKCIIMKGFDRWYDSRINGYIDDGKKVKLLGAVSPEEAISLALDEGKHGQRLSRSTKHI